MKIKIPPIARKSTKSFFQEAKQIPSMSLFDQLHGYVYFHWPYLYIRIAKGDHKLSKILGPIVKWVASVLPENGDKNAEDINFADTYHGKVVPTAAAVQLVTIQEEIQINDLERIIPYAKARSIVMKNPDHIVALECPCRSSREKPCLPLDVCLIVGEPFASLFLDHHPQRARKITSTEAVSILEAERERGHVSHAFFKDAMLGRFYAICNCCQCCCGAMQAYQNGTPMLASSGYIAQVDTDLCGGCGECETLCPFKAITLDDGISTVEFEACMGCGVCEAHCQEAAISLILCENKGIPLEIEPLIEERAF